jgi:hypothetical protein
MVESLNIDRVNGIAAIEISKDELKSIVNSVQYITDQAKKEFVRKFTV